ncbi:MAG: hypothetical protein ABW082_15825 [Sedimenticola sp.]
MVALTESAPDWAALYQKGVEMACREKTTGNSDTLASHQNGDGMR